MRTDTPPVRPPAFLHSVSTASRSGGDDIHDPTWPASAMGYRWCLRMNQGKAPEFFAPSSLPLLMLCCLRSHSHHWRALLNLKRVVSPPSLTPPLSYTYISLPVNYCSSGFKGKSARDRAKASRSLPHPLQPSVIKQAGKVSSSAPEVEAALFFQPGKAGFYSPVQATPTPERLQAFRGVGRMIGLGLLLSEVFPLPLCRHVLKFVMMREVCMLQKIQTFLKMPFLNLPYLVVK